MIAIVTILLAFPLGYGLRSRAAASLAYAVAYLWAFTFQLLYLLLDAIQPDTQNPAFEVNDFPASYGLVTLAIFGVGFALVEVGHPGVRASYAPPGHPGRVTRSAERAGAVDDDVCSFARAFPREEPGLVGAPPLPVRHERMAVTSQGARLPEVIRRLDPDQQRAQVGEPGCSRTDSLDHQQGSGFDRDRLSEAARQPVVAAVGTRAAFGQRQQHPPEQGVDLGQSRPARVQVVHVDHDTGAELADRGRQGRLAGTGRPVETNQPTAAERCRTVPGQPEDGLRAAAHQARPRPR